MPLNEKETNTGHGKQTKRSSCAFLKEKSKSSFLFTLLSVWLPYSDALNYLSVQLLIRFLQYLTIALHLLLHPASSFLVY